MGASDRYQGPRAELPNACGRDKVSLALVGVSEPDTKSQGQRANASNTQSEKRPAADTEPRCGREQPEEKQWLDQVKLLLHRERPKMLHGGSVFIVRRVIHGLRGQNPVFNIEN